MTRAELIAARERSAKATPGPWDATEYAHGATPWNGNKERVYRVEIVSPQYTHGRRTHSRLIAQMVDYCDWTDHPANREFIIQSRADVPALCDSLESAMAELQRIWDGGLRSDTMRDLLRRYFGEDWGE
jgi:hypothetical protein